MAEFVMKDLVKKAHRESDFVIDSAAVSSEEEGNGIYPPAKRKMQEHRIPFDAHRAHKISASEMDHYDLIIIMDQSNYRILSRIARADQMAKVHMLMEYPGISRDVDDPWYSGDFEQAYQDILLGCTKLLESLENEA